MPHEIRRDSQVSHPLWVLTDNTRAIQFYGRVGFVADEESTKEVIVGGNALREIRYVAQLQN